MLRPEALAQLHRWREAAIGCGLTGLGLWIAVTSLGLGILAGAVVMLIGLALVFTGTRHALFRSARTAPGVVEVIEGRITYLGPVMGSSIALADLREITFTRTPEGQSCWRLQGLAPHPVIIPSGAAGEDLLLDTFTALPKFDTAPMIRAVQSRTAVERVIWRHPGTLGPARTLT